MLNPSWYDTDPKNIPPPPPMKETLKTDQQGQDFIFEILQLQFIIFLLMTYFRFKMLRRQIQTYT